MIAAFAGVAACVLLGLPGLWLTILTARYAPFVSEAQGSTLHDWTADLILGHYHRRGPYGAKLQRLCGPRADRYADRVANSGRVLVRCLLEGDLCLGFLASLEFACVVTGPLEFPARRLVFLPPAHFADTIALVIHGRRDRRLSWTDTAVFVFLNRGPFLERRRALYFTCIAVKTRRDELTTWRSQRPSFRQTRDVIQRLCWRLNGARGLKSVDITTLVRRNHPKIPPS